MGKKLSEELEEIDAQIKKLEEQRHDIYRRSLEAPEEEKVCADALSKMIIETSFFEGIEYPIEVSAINWEDSDSLSFCRGDGPTLVAVRPADSEKTYVGIYVGDLPLGVSASYHTESGVLSLHQGHQNPAIVVPALKKVVMGCESWWQPIESEDDFKKITDEDIENVWYVKSLRRWAGKDE